MLVPIVLLTGGNTRLVSTGKEEARYPIMVCSCGKNKKPSGFTAWEKNSFAVISPKPPGRAGSPVTISCCYWNAGWIIWYTEWVLEIPGHRRVSWYATNIFW